MWQIIHLFHHNYELLIRKLTYILSRFSSKKHLIILGMLLLLLVAIVLPAAEKDLESITKSSNFIGWYLLFDPSELIPHISRLSEEARTFYVFYLLTIDLVFPFIYSIFFCLVLVRIRKTALSALPAGRTLLPLLLLCINILENALLIYLIMSISSIRSYLIGLLWSINFLKWLILLIIAFDMIRGLGIILLTYLKRYKQDQLLP